MKQDSTRKERDSDDSLTKLQHARNTLVERTVEGAALVGSLIRPQDNLKAYERRVTYVVDAERRKRYIT